MADIIHAEESYKIIGACFEVYKEKGCGFLEAVSELSDGHRAPVLNYLNATGLRLGLLANFGHYPKLQWERIVV